MEIKVFGPGCARCSETEQRIRDVVTARGVAASIIKVSDLKDIMMAGVMATPGVAVDGVLKVTGRVPSQEEIISWLDCAGAQPAASDASGTLAPDSGAEQAGTCCSCGGRC